MMRRGGSHGMVSYLTVGAMCLAADRPTAAGDFWYSAVAVIDFARGNIKQAESAAARPVRGARIFCCSSGMEHQCLRPPAGQR
jgi:hypothetical protein